MLKLFVRPSLSEVQVHQMEKEVHELLGLEDVELSLQETVCGLGAGVTLAVGGRGTSQELQRAYDHCRIRLQEQNFEIGLY